MATGVYLKWEGKDEEAFQKEWMRKGDYNAGDIGYLHAQGNMINENRVLHCLFPGDYWTAPEPLPYDFEGNFHLLETWARIYLAAALTGRVIDLHLEDQEPPEFSLLLMEFIQGKERESEIDASLLHGNLNYSVMWLNSLYNFFHLGFTLQISDKNPRVFIC